jgi:hypothetical protein
MNEKAKKIYITVGHRFSSIPNQNKVKFLVLPEWETETKVAKKFRKKCAEKPQIYLGFTGENQKAFKPSELYWAIFDNLDDEKPRISSKNYIQGNLVSVHIFMMIGV